MWNTIPALKRCSLGARVIRESVYPIEPSNDSLKNISLKSSTALLNYIGTSTTASTGNPNYSYSTLQPQNRQGLTVRGDYIQSHRSQYVFRYSSGNEDITSTGLLGAGSKIITNYYQYMGSNTWTITPNFVNEARFGYSHFFNSLGLLSAYTNDVVDAVKIPGLSGDLPSTWAFQPCPLTRDRRAQQRTSGRVWGSRRGWCGRGPGDRCRIGGTSNCKK